MRADANPVWRDQELAVPTELSSARSPHWQLETFWGSAGPVRGRRLGPPLVPNRLRFAQMSGRVAATGGEAGVGVVGAVEEGEEAVLERGKRGQVPGEGGWGCGAP